MWHSHNGERLGTYDGHNGTVWTIDVDCESLLLHLFMLWQQLAEATGSARRASSSSSTKKGTRRAFEERLGVGGKLGTVAGVDGLGCRGRPAQASGEHLEA